LPDAFARFSDKEKAQGSPLAARLFAIEGVSRVDIMENSITVTKNIAGDWRAIGPAIGKTIREHIQSGESAVSAETLRSLPEEDKLRARVQQILEYQINPAVAGHGGVITLLDVQGKDIFIKMGGGCQGCSSADATLRGGIEQALREQIPEIEQILDVTDHAEGKNPYYSAH
jgi:Fe-S cluster biogenesis protein NfuA